MIEELPDDWYVDHDGQSRVLDPAKVLSEINRLQSANESIGDWLKEMAMSADHARRESNSFAPNSYGSGYDQGRYDALREVLEKLNDLWVQTAEWI